MSIKRNDKNIQKPIRIGMGIYMFTFAVYALLSLIMPVVQYTQAIEGIIFAGFAGIGLLFVLYDIIFERQIFRTKLGILLLVFIGVTIVSSILNIRFGITDNLKTICWMVIHTFIYYTMYLRIDRDVFFYWLKRALAVLATIWNLSLVISVFQFFMQISYTVDVNDHIRLQGFCNNRLYGIYSDPNYAAIVSIFVILYMVWALRESKKIWSRIIEIVSILINITYVTLSWSRTAMIALVAASALLGLCYGKNIALAQAKSLWGQITITILCSAICVGGILGSTKVIWNVMYYYSEEVMVVNASSGINEQEEPDTQDYFDERYGTIGETNNVRVYIWKYYLRSMKGKEWWGMSPRNALPYITWRYPDIYIAQTQYETHNGFLSVYVSTGRVGLCVTLLFMIGYAVMYIKDFFKEKQLDDYYIFTVCMILVILIKTMFFTELFFVNNLTSILFYTIVGFGLPRKLKQSEEEEGAIINA